MCCELEKNTLKCDLSPFIFKYFHSSSSPCHCLHVNANVSIKFTLYFSIKRKYILNLVNIKKKRNFIYKIISIEIEAWIGKGKADQIRAH